MIAQSLERLGVKRLLLAIHDISFPSDPDEDIGRGAPTTRAAARLFAYARSLGFTGIQLGPQGQTDAGNPSPYDATIFSRHLATIALSSFRAGGPYEGLVDSAVLDQLVTSGPTNHVHAHDASRRLVAEFASPHLRGHAAQKGAERWIRPRAGRPSLRNRIGTFIEEHEGAGRWLFSAQRHPESPFLFGLGQFLAHEEHARLRDVVGKLGLALYGDLHVGYSPQDASTQRLAFLPDYVMGAPPSRTNPAGQAWNYPILDPDQIDVGRARALFTARIDKMFAEYDSIRIDHPHGLICPWVYRANTDDPSLEVRDGARLYESPGVPGLAGYAIAREDQIDHAKPRYHDHWVSALDDDQVARYARLFDVVADSATRHGRSINDVSCEVLSTMPYPLGRVLERFGLGRWRVFQKANLDDAKDVYRVENAQRPDWVMLGNHDTQPILAVIAGWSAARRAAWVRHLCQQLRMKPDARFERNGFVATAMLATLFASEAENVSIFFADLFGETTRFNTPGTVSSENWCLRLPPDFDRLHRERLERGEAIDLSMALSLALDARENES